MSKAKKTDTTTAATEKTAHVCVRIPISMKRDLQRYAMALEAYEERTGKKLAGPRATGASASIRVLLRRQAAHIEKFIADNRC